MAEGEGVRQATGPEIGKEGQPRPGLPGPGSPRALRSHRWGRSWKRRLCLQGQGLSLAPGTPSSAQPALCALKAYRGQQTGQSETHAWSPPARPPDSPGLGPRVTRRGGVGGRKWPPRFPANLGAPQSFRQNSGSIPSTAVSTPPGPSGTIHASRSFHRDGKNKA